MKYQTNSMSFYQKMNIRQNCIEGNLLSSNKEEIEKRRCQQLRYLKWDYMELRHDMRRYNEHLRTKIRKRKEESSRKREIRVFERAEGLRLEAEEEPVPVKAMSPIQYLSTPVPMCMTPNASLRRTPPTPHTPPKPRRDVRRSYSAMAQMSGTLGKRIGEELMEELGLKGVDLPDVDVEGGWGKVSRTALNLHREWDKERSEEWKRGRSQQSNNPVVDITRASSGKSDRVRNNTKSHQSYFQTCLSRPFAYEDFADRKISCRENENQWKNSLRDPSPRVYKRFAASGEEDSLVQRQFSERNLEKAKAVRREFKKTAVVTQKTVDEKITRMKFTSSKMLEERAEVERRAEEGRLNTDKLIRRHKYLDKSVTVADISRERPSYLRYRSNDSSTEQAWDGY